MNIKRPTPCDDCAHREAVTARDGGPREEYCPHDRPEWPNGTNCPLYAPWATVDGD